MSLTIKPPLFSTVARLLRTDCTPFIVVYGCTGLSIDNTHQFNVTLFCCDEHDAQRQAQRYVDQLNTLSDVALSVFSVTPLDIKDVSPMMTNTVSM